MADADRLAALVEELVADPRYAKGRRPFPRPVSPDDAADVAEAMHAEIDRGTEARAAAASEAGMRLACQRGCHACCEEMVMVNLAEAHAVARWLLRPENTAARRGFVARYPAWRAAIGDRDRKFASAMARGDQTAQNAIYLEQTARGRALCALNDGGDCTVYPVRPLLCRTGHALDTADLCRPPPEGARRPAQLLQFAPLDQFAARAFTLLWAAHHAIGGERRRPEALCEAVYRIVTATAS